MELLPAVLIGGPPHSGKSVLAYSLTRALREAKVDHLLLRACPDGEGDWSHETPSSTVRLLRFKQTWSQAWVDGVCQAIAHRQLPLLVDTGGKIDRWQEEILSHCTETILISGDPADLDAWRETADRCGTPILAELESSLSEPGVLWSAEVPLRGRLHGLERGSTAAGPAFEALLAALTALLAYPPGDLRRRHLAAAPVDNTLDLEQFGAGLGVVNNRWRPADLPNLLAEIEGQTPLAVYGRGPNWLYAALARHTDPAPFYQFDPRLGWVSPPALALGSPPAESPLLLKQAPEAAYERLELWLRDPYLDYTESERLVLPPLPLERGLVLSGQLPHWLFTALVRLYRQAPWLAIYQPPLGGKAVVVGSSSPGYPVGGVVDFVAGSGPEEARD
jgi:CRISPR-associated protein Csx3